MKNYKKNISIFLISQAVSLFGSSLVQYAILWYVAKEFKLGIYLSLITACGFLPQVLISLFAGVWADRYNRKLLIIAADGVIALSTLALALTIIFTNISSSGGLYWLLLFISAVRSVGAGIQTPAVNAYIPQLVPTEHLMKVSGLNGSVQSIINLVSPAVAGSVLAFGEIQYVMFIDIITAAVGISMLFFVKAQAAEKVREHTKYFDDLKEGVAYAVKKKFLRQLLCVSIVFCIMISPGLFFNVLYVTRKFGDSYWTLTLNQVLFFVGALSGGLVLGAWGGFTNRLKTLGIGAITFGVACLLIGFTQQFWIYLILICIVGFACPFNNAPLTVLIQEKVEPEMQGRVFSLAQIVTSVMIPVGVMLCGPLADLFPLQYIMSASGAGLLILAVIVFKWKSFYKSGMRPTI